MIQVYIDDSDAHGRRYQVASFQFNWNDRAERAVFSEQCRNALFGGQRVTTQMVPYATIS